MFKEENAIIIQSEKFLSVTVLNVFEFLTFHIPKGCTFNVDRTSNYFKFCVSKMSEKEMIVKCVNYLD